ncbi:ribonuclease H-like domain-containing protein [Tanacetum coccineum]
MESQSETTQTVSALKLPVLKTGEYDLWSMRMEQYLTFTDHALWEVIVNGDSVSPVASASAGAEGPIPPKTAEQKLAWKNELKAKSTLMLAIPDEHLLKFHACKDAKSLWEAIKNRWAFVSSDNSSSTNETINTAHSGSAASSKDQASTTSYVDDVMFSFFPNQSNAPQLDNKDLEQIDVDDLEEMDLKWQVAMLTTRVKRFIKKIGKKLDLNEKETVGFVKTKVECYNCHRRGHFARECRAPRNKGNKNRDAPRRNVPVDTSTTNALVVQDGIGSSSSDSKGIDEISVFKSLRRKTTTSVPKTKTSISKTSKDIIEKPKTVRPSAPIIKEWDIDNDNDSMFRPKSNQTKPKFTKINFVKSGENVKSVNKENTHRQVEYPRKSQSPRGNRRNWNGMMTQKLGNEKLVLNNKGRVTGQREIRPVWNNAQRVNHQNKLNHPHPKRNFVPTAVATKSGQVPVNAAKQSSPRAATSISTARPVNTAAPKPKVNDALPITYSYFQAHSPVDYKADSESVMAWVPKKTNSLFRVADYQEIDGGFVAFGGSPKREDVVTDDTGKKTTEEPANEDERNGQEKEGGASNKEEEAMLNITNKVSIVSPSVSADGQSFINANDLPTDPLMPDLEDTTDLLNTGIFSGAYDDEDVGAEADLNTWKQP